MAEFSASANGFRLAYDRLGSGPPVILLHGWPGEIDRLADLYARPGAMISSISFYLAGAGTVAQSLAEIPPPENQRIQGPTTVVWPDDDALFPSSGAAASTSFR